MNIELAKKWIEHWEGRRATVYKDTKGIPTIGVGFNLMAAGAEQAILNLGVPYPSVVSGFLALTEDATGRAGAILSSSVGSQGPRSLRPLPIPPRAPCWPRCLRRRQDRDRPGSPKVALAVSPRLPCRASPGHTLGTTPVACTPHQRGGVQPPDVNN